MASLFTSGRYQGFDGAVPAAGGLLYTYAAGTTTLLATYTTQAGNVPNANPVVLDASGRAPVRLGASSYRMVLKSSLGVTISDDDNIIGTESTSAAGLTGFDSSTAYAAGTVGKRLHDMPATPAWKGGDNTGGTPSTSALQAAADSLGTDTNELVLPVGTSWAINDQVTINGKTNFRISGKGKITQSTANKAIFVITNCSDFEVDGLSLYGRGTDFVPGADTANGVGVRLENCTNFRVVNTRFRNFGYAAVRVIGGCSAFSIDENDIQGTHTLGTPIAPGDTYQFGVIVQSGLSLAAPCSDFSVDGNRIQHVAMACRVEPLCFEYSFDENRVRHVIGQHGAYLNGTAFTACGNTVRDAYIDGIKAQAFQNTGLAVNEGLSHVLISDNRITNCGSGISVEKTSALANTSNNVKVSGNIISGISATGTGVYVSDTTDALISDNSISGGAYGILATVVTSGVGVSGAITGNRINDSLWCGISGYVNKLLTVSDNTILRPCTAAIAADPQQDAIHIAGSNAAHRVTIDGNTVMADTSTGVVYGLHVDTVASNLGANDLGGSPISYSGTASIRVRAGAGDFAGRALWAGIGIVGNAGYATTTITVTGVALGDIVTSVSLGSDLQGCALSASVTAANTLRIVINNLTGAGKTIADGFVRYAVARLAS